LRCALIDKSAHRYCNKCAVIEGLDVNYTRVNEAPDERDGRWGKLNEARQLDTDPRKEAAPNAPFPYEKRGRPEIVKEFLAQREIDAIVQAHKAGTPPDEIANMLLEFCGVVDLSSVDPRDVREPLTVSPPSSQSHTCPPATRPAAGERRRGPCLVAAPSRGEWPRGARWPRRVRCRTRARRQQHAEGDPPWGHDLGPCNLVCERRGQPRAIWVLDGGAGWPVQRAAAEGDCGRAARLRRHRAHPALGRL